MRIVGASGRLGALVLLAAAPVAASAPAPPRFEAGVTLVTLSVFVTDEHGQPVRGLTAADFEVLDDGKPAAVGHCQEIDALERIPGRSSGSPAIQAASRRQFLFLFDLSFLSAPASGCGKSLGNDRRNSCHDSRTYCSPPPSRRRPPPRKRRRTWPPKSTAASAPTTPAI